MGKSRGMNLDATKRADEMQKEIQALDTEIEALHRDDLERETRSWRVALKQRKEEIRKAEGAFRRTMNLCYEANSEKKCMFCLDRDECEAYKAVRRVIEMMDEE